MVRYYLFGLVVCVMLMGKAQASSLPEFVVESGINSVVLMPNERLHIVLSDEFVVSNTVPWLSQKSQHVFLATAPSEPGFYHVALGDRANRKTLLQLVVKTPIDTAKISALKGYRFNTYPQAYKSLAQYAQPKGLIEVKKGDENIYLSDLVQVKNMLSKQKSDFPKYFLATTEGLKMLNRLKDFLISKGIKFKRFSFISGYRTPYYNRMIGNGKHSRHQYGDAFDLYIDENGDQRMDDLNGDGVQNKKDVDYLYTLFVAFLKHDNRQGGVGKYYPNARHGGFVHIDNRGFNARW